MIKLTVNNIQECNHCFMAGSKYNTSATPNCNHKIGDRKVVPNVSCRAKESSTDSSATDAVASISAVGTCAPLKSLQMVHNTTSLCEIVIKPIPSKEIKGMVSPVVLTKATEPTTICTTGGDMEIPDPLGDQIPDEFCCPVSFEFLREPAMAKGDNRIHRVERELLHDWVAAHGTNPLTMLPMSTKDIVVDNILKEQISSWLARHPKHHATAQQEAAAAKAASINRIWHEPIQALLAAGHTDQAFHLSKSGEVIAGSSPDVDVRTYSRSVWREDGLGKREILINEAANFANISNGHIPATLSFNKVKYIVINVERVRSDAMLIRCMAPTLASLAVISTKTGILVGKCVKFNFSNMCIDLEKIAAATLHD